MDDPYAVNRRGFLRTSATAAAAATVACAAPEGQWRALTNAEAATLAAVCDSARTPTRVCRKSAPACEKTRA